MKYHLVILKKRYLQAILDGRKDIESRFSRTRLAVFEQVQPGDRLFLKVSSGPVCGLATAAAVESFDQLAPEQLLALKRRYNHRILGSETYWRSKLTCRFGLLVWLADIRRIEPVPINKKDWRAWVVLTPEEDFGLLGRIRWTDQR